MTLRPSVDLAAAAWLSQSDAEPGRLLTFGPAVFPAYARLRYIPDPARPGMNEAEVQLPVDHPTDIESARIALTALVEYSSSTDSLCVCVWEGQGTLRASNLARGPLVRLPHRRYVLFSGTLNDLESWNELFVTDVSTPPAFVWPADHRWCFASDVDPHWAGIGADPEVIERLVADPRVDVVRADPDEQQPTYY